MRSFRLVFAVAPLLVAACSAPATEEPAASASDLVAATRITDLRSEPRFFRAHGANPTRPVAVGTRHLFIGETGSNRDRGAPFARWIYETSGTEASTRQVAKLELAPWGKPVTASGALYFIAERRTGLSSDRSTVVQRWADPASGIVDLALEGVAWGLVATDTAAYVVTIAKGTTSSAPATPAMKRIYKLTRTSNGRDVVTKLFEAPTKDGYSYDPIAVNEKLLAFVNDDVLFLSDGVAAPQSVAEVPNSYHLAFTGDRLFMTDYIHPAGAAVTYRLAEVVNPYTTPRMRGYGALPSEPRRIVALGDRPVVFTKTGMSPVNVDAGTIASFPCKVSDGVSTLVVDSKLYALDKGGSLFVTDGTLAGTKAVVTRTQSSLGSLDATPNLVAFDGGIYYFDEAKKGDVQLTRLDPATGTLTKKSSFPIGAHFANLQTIGSRLVFGAGGSTEKELWTYDGTTSSMIETNAWGNASARPEPIAAGENLVFFTTQEDSSWEGPRGSEMSLWATNGTEAGTRKVHTGNYQVFGLDRDLSSTRFAVAGDCLCVLSEKASQRSVVCTDGSAAGTQEIAVAAGGVRPIAFGGGIFAVASRADHGSDIVRIDGATGAVSTMRSLPSSSSVTRLLTNSDGLIAFVQSNDAAAKGIWTSDGTAANTRRMVPDASFMGWDTIVLGASGRKVFLSSNGNVFMTDGTQAGTRSIGYVNTTDNLDSGAALGAAFVFSGGDEVWRAEGTTITQLTTGANVYSRPIPVGGKLAFKTDGGVVLTDGTALGTKTFTTGKYSSLAATPDGSLLVSNWDKQSLSLIRDGAVVNAEPSRKTAANIGFVSVPGGLIFSGPIEGRGMELLFTDGKVGGTRVLAETFLGEGSSDPHGLLVAHGKVFFSATDANGDEELYAVPVP